MSGETSRVSALRHFHLFSPKVMNDINYHVIGVGAIGSKIAMSLAKLGLTTINVWDDDEVAEHNIANQAYGVQEIGMQKVDAIKKVILRDTGTEITIHNEKVDKQSLDGIVFLAVDTMTARKAIFENVLKLKLKIPIIIDTRMGADILRVYSVNPKNAIDIKGYEGSLYGDDEAEESYCGSKTSVGPTASITAEYAIWQLIKWYNKKYEVIIREELGDKFDPEDDSRDNTIPSESIISLRPDDIMITTFE